MTNRPSMSSRSSRFLGLVSAGLACAIALTGFAGAARADDWHRHDDHRHWDDDHRHWHYDHGVRVYGYGYAPPVYYAPPPPVYYAPPPPPPPPLFSIFVGR